MEKHQEDFEPVFEGMSFSNIDCKGFPDSVTISNGKDLYHFETRDYVPLEAVEELIEKATPKKPINQSTPLVRQGYCPNCKGELRKLGSRNEVVIVGQLYCCSCGQALDWSEE